MSTYTIETTPFITDREERAAYYDDLAFRENRKVENFIAAHNLSPRQVQDNAYITYMLHQRDNYRALASLARDNNH